MSRDRFRVTTIKMSGPDLNYVDNRLLAVQLVKNGMSHAMMFDKDGNVQQPSEMLYKKNVIAFRGSFRPITYISKDILRKSFELFQKDEDYEANNTLSFCEISLNNLLSEGELDERDFLERVNMLNAIGQNVMVSDIREYYRLREFFSQFKLKQLRLVIGVPTLEKVMDDSYYDNLNGGLLEAMGKLFAKNTKLYVYPTLRKKENNEVLIASRDIRVKEKYRLLYEYLLQNRYVLDLKSDLSKQLHIKSHQVLETIKEKGLFRR